MSTQISKSDTYMIKPHGNRTNQTLTHSLDAQLSKNESHVVLRCCNNSKNQAINQSSGTQTHSFFLVSVTLIHTYHTNLLI